MNASIPILEAALSAILTNEPVNRAEGNLEQADKQLRDIADIEHTLLFLDLNRSLNIYNTVWEREGGKVSNGATDLVQLPSYVAEWQEKGANP